MAAAPPAPDRPHLHGFDGLRALAAGAIVVYHLAFVLAGFDVVGRDWITRLNIGVPIFFVISGALLYLPFALARAEGRGHPSLRDYAARRVARIGPAYWVALPIIALVLGLSGVFTLEGLVRYGLFLQIYSPATFTGGIGQAWTLDVEVVLYAFLALWVATIGAVATRRGEIAGLVAVIALSLAWKVVVGRLVADGDADLTLLAWPPAWADQFALGMLLAVAAARGVALRPVTGAVLTGAAAAGFLLLGALDPQGGIMVRNLTDHVAKTAIAVALVAPVALRAAPALWSSTPMRWLGIRSYGVYLWHLAVMIQLDRWDAQDRIGTVGFVVVAVAVSVGLGWASWVLIERPSIGIGRTLGKAWARRPAPPRAVAVDVGGAIVVLGCGPVIAFASGGFFDTARLVAAVIVWSAVGVVAVAGSRPWPTDLPARAAIAALALLVAWTGIALDWAPVAESAVDDVQRGLLYLGVLVLSVATLGGAARRYVLPVHALGAIVVVGYGLVGRLAPWLIDVTQTASSAGRLEQPLTYWNAMGLLAAMGLTACVSLAGDPTRRAAMRGAALAAGPALVLGLWLSFSRGGIVAALAGLAAAALLAPGGAAVRAALAVVVLGVPPSLMASALDGVRAAEGGLSSRALEGALEIGILVLCCVLAARARGWVADGDGRGAPRLRVQHAGVVVAGAVVVVLAALAVVVGLERGPGVGTPQTGATADRLASTDSNRYAYWRVALGAAEDDPLTGTGPGGFAVVWLRDRDIDEPVRDAHSLPIETLAELGLVGLLFLLAFAAAIGMGAVRARRTTALAAGPASVTLVWAIHACVDWDWEMPAVTIPALTAMGFLLALADGPQEAQP
ncbi:acyltransferase [Svornostia abyssi]|uniref:Acyltransferase n=1 Tax=Svornostia abyssi TaxID=2898438 RepID=A0ABY5PDX9_9ACTN|nr:acyltransferase [Parviterribacteraceae bacterium J379]